MATNTYTALQTQTLGSAVSSVTFSSIPSTHTDLVLVMNVGTSGTGTSSVIQFNNDTGTNYSITDMYGDGSTAGSARTTSGNVAYLSYYIGAIPSIETTLITNIMNYSNDTTYKTFLTRNGRASSGSYPGTEAIVGLWRQSTPAAIHTIKISTTSGTFGIGSTFTIYGVAAASVGAKATGGMITSDSTYWYHSFTNSGTFTPTQSLSCDILAVAGGGGAGIAAGGGGGAGGVITFGSQSLTATGYTVTVGAGGAKSPSDGVDSSNGTNSTFGALTAAVGGGGGANGSGTTRAGHNGGSGGGAGSYAVVSPGSSTQTGTGALNYYGNSGGAGAQYCGAGGGGAGAAAGYSTNTLNAGNGGIGKYDTLINAMGAGAGIGELSGGNYYLAAGGMGWNGSNGTAQLGGGGGGDRPTSGAGVANTGGGGGWTNGAVAWGNGGSGIVVVRYAK